MFDENRPKIDLKKTALDHYIEYTTFGLIIFSIGYAFYHYSNLPESIPMHFSYSGNVNSYGSKDSIWALNIIGAASVFGLYYLNKFPHIFNYPKKITLENAEKYYTDATRMIRYLNLGMAIIFTIICYEVIKIALDPTVRFSKFAHYTVMIIVVSMTLFPFVYIFKNLKKKN